MKVLRKEEVQRESDIEPLEALIDEVAEDAASLQKNYLKESVVPEGGE